MRQFGDTEVEDFDRAGIGDKNVVGFEIAMHDPLLMGAIECTHHRFHELDGALRRQRLTQQLRQRRALKVFEHHKRLAHVFADFVNNDDVFMAASGRGPRFYQEPRRHLGLFGVEKFDGDTSAELDVPGHENRPHAATPELADQLVGADPGARRWQSRTILHSCLTGKGHGQRPPAAIAPFSITGQECTTENETALGILRTIGWFCQMVVHLRYLYLRFASMPPLHYPAKRPDYAQQRQRRGRPNWPPGLRGPRSLRQR